jgi:hypothetical protein
MAPVARQIRLVFGAMAPREARAASIEKRMASIEARTAPATLRRPPDDARDAPDDGALRSIRAPREPSASTRDARRAPSASTSSFAEDLVSDVASEIVRHDSSVNFAHRYHGSFYRASGFGSGGSVGGGRGGGRNVGRCEGGGSGSSGMATFDTRAMRIPSHDAAKKHRASEF